MNIFSIIPESPPPFEEKVHIYVYTIGHKPLRVEAALLAIFLTENMPGYFMHVDKEDDTINLIETGYKKYIIRELYFGVEQHFGDYKSAYIYFAKAINGFPNGLVEFITTDWRGDILNYKWHKKFTYNKHIKRKIPTPDIDKTHPYGNYRY